MHAPAQAVARGLAQGGGARLVAARLLDLEARLPPEHALACAGFALWQAWRRGVERAESPAELVPQVRGRLYRHGSCSGSGPLSCCARSARGRPRSSCRTCVGRACVGTVLD
jgi:hypothetical protein